VCLCACVREKSVDGKQLTDAMHTQGSVCACDRERECVCVYVRVRDRSL